MTSFTSRYGNPAVDYLGAHLWVHCRHTVKVVAVAGIRAGRTMLLPLLRRTD